MRRPFKGRVLGPKRNLFGHGHKLSTEATGPPASGCGAASFIFRDLEHHPYLKHLPSPAMIFSINGGD
jgi:hypothetical protein